MEDVVSHHIKGEPAKGGTTKKAPAAKPTTKKK